ncbi:rhomboid family intramembrane serine protease [Altericista sp. CCNU0014]|uniref:rhomboid family intramembrane serine protease n=1 Tax=Altericista sp. CCNU0014 TaxID=3082949 RepID=UPI00384AB8A4
MSKDPSVEAKLKKMMAQLDRESHPLRSQTKETLPRSQPKTRQGLKFGSTHWKSRFFIPLAILSVPWTQHIVNTLFFGGRWDFPIYPRSVEGIPGIFLSAFSHGSWGHLIGNTIAFAIFSWLILAKNARDFWITFAIGWLGGGLACWLLGPQAVHGLSGVVYTLFGYLLVIGWLEKRFLPLALSVFVAVNFSYVAWGVFPTDARVAWWGHLLGFLLGVFSAYGVYREPKRSG